MQTNKKVAFNLPRVTEIRTLIYTYPISHRKKGTIDIKTIFCKLMLNHADIFVHNLARNGQRISERLRIFRTFRCFLFIFLQFRIKKCKVGIDSIDDSLHNQW